VFNGQVNLVALSNLSVQFNRQIKHTRTLHSRCHGHGLVVANKRGSDELTGR
jgi:hypothetical protein